MVNPKNYIIGAGDEAISIATDYSHANSFENIENLASQKIEEENELDIFESQRTKLMNKKALTVDQLKFYKNFDYSTSVEIVTDTNYYSTLYF